MPDMKSFYAPQILADLAVGSGRQEFIADKVMPITFSPDQTGYFQSFDDSEFVNDPIGELVSPTSDVQYIDYDVDKNPYVLEGHSWKHFVPNAKDEQFAGQWLRGGVNKIMGKLLRTREEKVLDKVLGCGNALTITTKFDAVGATFGTVMVGLEQARKVVRDAVGIDPDTIVMGSDVWSVIVGHMAVAFGTSGMAATPQLLAEIAQFKQILISKATTKAAVGGNASAIWTAKKLAALVVGPTTEGSAGSMTTDYEPAYGKLVYWQNGALVDGMEWRTVENPYKGSHGGVDVQGVLYYDAVETLNDAATVGDALT